MKYLFIVSCAIVIFTSCSNIDFNQPLGSDTDPLSSPLVEKKQRQSTSSISSDQVFSPGAWVETAMPSASFYNKYPRFKRKPTYSLPVSTPVKVLGYKGKYAKVEKGGEVGYIESSMLIDQRESPSKKKSNGYNKRSKNYGKSKNYRKSNSYDKSSNYRKTNRSSSNSNQQSYKRKKSYKKLSSNPSPPTEDEILRKIRAREAIDRSQKAPVINVPSAPRFRGGFSPPEPEIKGLDNFSSSGTTISPPSVPKVPSVSSLSKPASSIKSDRANIRINKPFGSTISQSLGSKIDQNAALELRITERIK